MSNTVRKQCLICGRTFEIKALEEYASEWEAGPPEQGTSFCSLCKTKIKKEAGDAQKEPKSM